jgi:hypothetical protein
MAHFYGQMQGSRGETTRMGTKNSGLWAHLRGWDVGVEVRLDVDEDGHDTVTVWETGGSNNSSKVRKLVCVTKRELP